MFVEQGLLISIWIWFVGRPVHLDERWAAKLSKWNQHGLYSRSPVVETCRCRLTYAGSCFFGESMFSIKTNTSKLCLLYLFALLKKNNFILLDSQFFNSHLLQFGGYEIESHIYEDRLKKALDTESNFFNVKYFQEALSLVQSNNHRS